MFSSDYKLIQREIGEGEARKGEGKMTIFYSEYRKSFEFYSIRLNEYWF